MKTILILFFLISCSTHKKTMTQDLSKTANSNGFKKEVSLNNKNVQDFYDHRLKTMSPALEDETIDRLNPSELKSMKPTSDPLLDISLKCQKKDFESAFQLISSLFNRYQKTAPYWNQVANCHLLKGSYRKALLFYNKALEISPNYVPALNNIGVMYSKQGLDQKALVAFDRANKISKFSKTPRYNLSRLYLTYGLTEIAIPIFQSLLNYSPTDVDLLNSLGTAYLIQSDLEKSISYFNKIPKNFWVNPEIGLNLSLLYKRIGKLNEAKKVFDAITYPKDEKIKNYFEFVKDQIGET